MGIIKFKVDVDEKAVKQKVDNLINDKVMVEIHQLYAKIIEPFVPYGTGKLAKVEIYKDYIRYNTPYASYQYNGIALNSSKPIWGRDENGQRVVVGWKYKGKSANPHELGVQWRDYNRFPYWDFGYNLQTHPLASHHWDKKAMETQLLKFELGVKEILRKRASELYG